MGGAHWGQRAPPSGFPACESGGFDGIGPAESRELRARATERGIKFGKALTEFTVWFRSQLWALGSWLHRSGLDSLAVRQRPAKYPPPRIKAREGENRTTTSPFVALEHAGLDPPETARVPKSVARDRAAPRIDPLPPVSRPDVRVAPVERNRCHGSSHDLIRSPLTPSARLHRGQSPQRRGRAAEEKSGSAVSQGRRAVFRRLREKFLGRAPQQRLLLLEGEAAQLAAGLDAPAAGLCHRVKGLFHRSHE
jgi:hypothetical protein